MLIIQLLILSVLLLVIPFFVGGIFSAVEKGPGRRIFQWISGQFLIWVGIELISVVLIIKQEELDKAMTLFWWYIGAVFCFALGTLICQKVREGKMYSDVKKTLKKRSALCKALWCVFGGVMLSQLVRIAWNYDMTTNPEQETPFYVTSPFSMWIVFLARTSGMEPAAVEQVVLPIVFICMSYGVFYLLGAKLLVKKKEYQPLLLVIMSVLVILGEYVYKRYWADVWPLATSESEIMLLVGVLLPYLLFLLVLFAGILRKKKKV